MDPLEYVLWFIVRPQKHPNYIGCAKATSTRTATHVHLSSLKF